MSDVFISYSRRNIDFAKHLFTQLQQQGISVWADWDDLRHSAGWWDEITRGIDRASTFLFIISNDSLGSPVCTLELAHAKETGKRIIPVTIDSRPDFDAAIPVSPDSELLREMLAGRDLFQIIGDVRLNLQKIDWIFFGVDSQGNPKSEEESLADVVRTLRMDLAHDEDHARLLVRAREWIQASKATDLLLIGSEVERAETWQAKAEASDKEPSVTPLQANYIEASRAEQDRRRRVLRRSRYSAIAGVAIMILAIAAAIVAGESASRAQADADAAQLEVTVAAYAVATQQEAAVIANEAANAERTNVADAQATGTQIPPTLTQAAVIAEEALLEQEIALNFADVLLSEDNEERLRNAEWLVENYPDHPLPYTARGLLNQIAGETDTAIDNYTVAIELAPDDAQAYANLGGLYVNVGEYELAQPLLERAIELNPDLALAYTNLGAAYVNMGEFEAGLTLLNRAIELNPAIALAYSNRGVAHQGLGDPEEAIRDFEQAITLNPSYADAYYNMGVTYLFDGEFELAQERFTRTIELAPMYVSAYINLGIIYQSLGNPEEALRNFNLAVELDPTLAITYSNLGSLYLSIGEYAEALTNLNRAIELGYPQSDVYTNRASVYLNASEYELALQDIEQAIEIAPDIAFNYIMRGNIYYFRAQSEDSPDRAADLEQFLNNIEQAQARGFVPEPADEAVIQEVEAELAAQVP